MVTKHATGMATVDFGKYESLGTVGLDSALALLEFTRTRNIDLINPWDLMN